MERRRVTNQLATLQHIVQRDCAYNIEIFDVLSKANALDSQLSLPTDNYKCMKANYP